MLLQIHRIRHVTIKNYLWLLPFCSFLGGYMLLQHMIHVESLETPSLVGQTINQALVILSNHNVNIRLLAQKEEPDLPVGTILSQTPCVGQKIKSHQSIFLVTSKHPPVSTAPDMINKPIDQITQLLENSNIRARIHYLAHSYPQGRCFAQSPKPHAPLEHNELLLYISAHSIKPIIWPDFTYKHVEEVTELLGPYDITPHIVHTTPHKPPHICKICRIMEQRPLAGTLITLDNTKPLSVQLRVE